MSFIISRLGNASLLLSALNVKMNVFASPSLIASEEKARCQYCWLSLPCFCLLVVFLLSCLLLLTYLFVVVVVALFVVASAVKGNKRFRNHDGPTMNLRYEFFLL